MSMQKITTIIFLILLSVGRFVLQADLMANEPELPAMEAIRISDDGKGFVFADSKQRFFPWGFNYIGKFGRIVEDDWETDWTGVEKDFVEMKKLGANVCRLHLQLATYMKSPDEVDQTQIQLLKNILNIGQKNGIYLKLTGLNCFRLDKIPEWYDKLSEQDRWKVHARFWEEISKASANHPAVFCYDLMNEPVIGKVKEGEHPWLTGELEGFYFVQRISNQPGKRKPRKIASDWVELMVQSIRKNDKQHLVTVGVIPFAMIFPKAKPIFYSEESLKHLDFVSVHFYPKKGEVSKAVEALKVYDLGKPLVVGEVFPLQCSIKELDEFINQTNTIADGWIAHYFGYSIEEHKKGARPSGELSAAFLEYWKKKGGSIKASSN